MQRGGGPGAGAGAREGPLNGVGSVERGMLKQIVRGQEAGRPAVRSGSARRSSPMVMTAKMSAPQSAKMRRQVSQSSVAMPLTPVRLHASITGSRRPVSAKERQQSAGLPRVSNAAVARLD